jgi:hypothetical protein
MLSGLLMDKDSILEEVPNCFIFVPFSRTGKSEGSKSIPLTAFGSNIMLLFTVAIFLISFVFVVFSVVFFSVCNLRVISGRFIYFEQK